MSSRWIQGKYCLPLPSMPEIKGWKKGIILVPFSEEGVIFFPYNTMPKPMHDTIHGIIKCCVHYEFFFLPPKPSQNGQIVCCMTPPPRPNTTPILNVTNLVSQPSGSLALFSQSAQSVVSASAELGGESSVYSLVSLGG